MSTTYDRGLHDLGDGVSAWLLPDGSWGWSNAGLVRGDGESLLFDTLFDLPLTREMLDAMAPLTETAPIRHLVNSHANGDHCFGNELVPAEATVYAGTDFTHHLHEASPAVLQSMMESDYGPVGTAYLQRWFGPFTFTGISVREPEVTVDTSLTVDVGGRDVELLMLGPAHTASDLVAWVPDAGVLFAGDLLFLGGAPIVWAGPAAAWIDACDRMIALDPRHVVPGHGPVTDTDGIREVRSYLEFVRDYAAETFQAGMGWREAADRIDLASFDSLDNSERIIANLYTEYRHLDPETPQQGLPELIVGMAEWDAARSR